jgi:hypothetical protein
MQIRLVELLFHFFVSAGGELIIHAALHQKNSPTPQLISIHSEMRTVKNSFLIMTINQYKHIAQGFIP